MPPPIRVELRPHDPAWALLAEAERAALFDAIGDLLLVVHHIGSTAVPDIHAKPVVDLMPVVRDIGALDARRATIEGLGYRWWGELGLRGRRYCTKDDPDTGKRLLQLHAYAEGADDIERHLAFRDFLLQHPAVAADYDREKLRCQRLHPEDSHAYGECKSDWIRAVEARALASNQPIESME
jgi:GrpB-like predicted nucleotidyltransferase (UPF0157 family)